MRPSRWIGAGLLLALLAGAVVMHNQSSDPLVGTIPVGLLPCCVDVDPYTGHAFVANTADHTISVLDTHSGRVVRTVRVGAAPSVLAVDASTGRVFALNDGDSTVSVLDARTAAVLRTVAVAGPRHASVRNSAVLAVDERRGHIFVIHESPASPTAPASTGRVTVLDAGSGQVLRTVAVGRVPADMAVDEMRARLFVVNTNGGCVPRSSGWGLVPGAVLHRLPIWSSIVMCTSGKAVR